MHPNPELRPTAPGSLPLTHSRPIPGAFMDRYILLVGGNPYGHVYALNGSVVPTYGQAHQLCPEGKQDAPACRQGCHAKTAGSEYYNDIWAFDTVERVYGAVRSTSKEDPDLILPGPLRLDPRPLFPAPFFPSRPDPGSTPQAAMASR
jgi:hypothetical protein